MKVFFIKNLRGKGSVGDIKEVPDGYALNFLIAGGYAVKATDDVIKKHQQEQATKHALQQKESQEVEKVFHSVRDKQILLEATRKDLSGKLYKSITIAEIINQVRKDFGTYLKQDWFKHYKPIKQTGEHTIHLEHGPLTVKFTITVI
jgi:large subunit ribosomal protein L9